MLDRCDVRRFGANFQDLCERVITTTLQPDSENNCTKEHPSPRLAPVKTTSFFNLQAGPRTSIGVALNRVPQWVRLTEPAWERSCGGRER